MRTTPLKPETSVNSGSNLAGEVTSHGRPHLRRIQGRALVSVVAVSALMLTGCTIDKERFGSSNQAGPTGSASASVATDSAAPNAKPNPTGSQSAEGKEDSLQPTGSKKPSQNPKAARNLETAVRSVESKYSGQVGVAISNPSGSGSTASASYGSLQEGPAWSTAKVPVAIAASKRGGVTPQMRSAITASDNSAAEAVWRSLGAPPEAGAAATQVLREGGDGETQVQSTVTRPGFSAFGQTRWSLPNQATFGANVQCIAGANEVTDLMGQITAGQNYGLGTINGAHYKGGWGPDQSGAYLTRQFGFIPGGKSGTFVGVAIAAKPADGSYETGQAMLTELAKALHEPRGYGGTC